MEITTQPSLPLTLTLTLTPTTNTNRSQPMGIPAIDEYRHITRAPGVCGGRPIIRGTRITVRAIVAYYKMGLSVEEILDGLPLLSPAQVYDALSYYHDHSPEIEEDIKENRFQRLAERFSLRISDDGLISTENRRGS